MNKLNNQIKTTFTLNAIINKIYNKFNYQVLIKGYNNKNLFINSSLGKKTKRKFYSINLYDKVIVECSIFHPKKNSKIIFINKNNN